ncbi:Gibberellin 20 oxidase 2 [Capsicum annuum]|uniref:Gibberellin 20 oxidase 2 n=1 Tax=Capsicum annuum TaxID=4072 RepID=A0A2G2ZWJ3_CAPAN|nr:Gibberellin 20 oxidase 2 [Capsicum annuum]
MDIDCMNSNGKSSMLDEGKQLMLDASNMKHDSNIPKQYIWPDYEKPCVVAQELSFPVIDLRGFFSGDPIVDQQVSRLFDEAYSSHNFFLVNHGVDANLISNAHRYLDAFFDLQLSEKQKAQRKIGMSLGVEKSLFKDFSEENESIMRLNYYPSCQKPELTKGTGPHYDPTSLTIFHQDYVGGLEVFYGNKWLSINTNFNTFVVHMGDTFTIVRYMSAKTGTFCLNMTIEVMIHQETDGPPDPMARKRAYCFGLMGQLTVHQVLGGPLGLPSGLGNSDIA